MHKLHKARCELKNRNAKTKQNCFQLSIACFPNCRKTIKFFCKDMFILRNLVFVFIYVKGIMKKEILQLYGTYSLTVQA
jgi:hypothetical protein